MNQKCDALKAVMVLLLFVIWIALIFSTPLVCVLVAVGLGAVIIARAVRRARRSHA